MTVEEAAEALSLPLFRLEGLLERGTVAERDGYLRFKKSVAGKERGTAYFEEAGDVVRGFPKIRRILMLDPGVPNRFEGEVVVEEKMNGYNVRIARAGSETVALTRGGVRCPYTEHWVHRLMGEEAFSDLPELVICGEMVGPDNPYVVSDAYGVESVQFFVFDVRRKGSNEPLPVDERRELVEGYGLSGVRELARVGAGETDEIREIVEDLDSRGREGVVMKDPAMDLDPVKYTTSSGNCKDLRYAFRYFQEYGADFIYPRAVREGFQAVEFEADMDERANRLGRAILEPLAETAVAGRKGERILEPVSVRVFDLSVVEEFERHLRSTGVDAIFREPEELDDGSYRVRIDRVRQGTDDKTANLLAGGFW
ncbi:MAG: hypothetical protein MAG715_00380 [Methanonatronarchaeales archaeon]|nr:hypothetical protein [Methanonatronarchaeales archaeon]